LNIYFEQILKVNKFASSLVVCPVAWKCLTTSIHYLVIEDVQCSHPNHDLINQKFGILPSVAYLREKKTGVPKENY
jgi:hypothetical protein